MITHGTQPDLLPEKSVWKRLEKLAASGAFRTLADVVPVILHIRGQPMTFEQHFPFEEIFRRDLPKRLVLRAGRQVGKSTSVAAFLTMLSVINPSFQSLYVTALSETTRRFSRIHLRSFLDSPVIARLLEPRARDSVMFRQFRNGSFIILSYAKDSADRIRGIPADLAVLDEAQDIAPDVVPEIREVLSHSKWGVMAICGTSKTLDTTLEMMWTRSSMREFCIKCTSCGYWNVPSLEHDIMEMIGEDVDVSEERPGIVCAKCRKHSLNPRSGEWVPADPSRVGVYEGYHIPQIIMPFHYASPVKWAELLEKKLTYTITEFYNEVLGEPHEMSVRLLSEKDLQSACMSEVPNDLEHAARRARSGRYVRYVLGIDWGGGGEDEVSMTAVALACLCRDGAVEVLYGERMSYSDPVKEIERVIQLIKVLMPDFVVHDYHGAGYLREAMLREKGYPIEKIIPVSYTPPRKGYLMEYVSRSAGAVRDYYQLDKTRSLLITTAAIRSKVVRFFQYDYVGPSRPGLLSDFLNLVEHVVDRVSGTKETYIRKRAGSTDDFAQAVNIACCALWYPNRWPGVARSVVDSLKTA